MYKVKLTRENGKYSERVFHDKEMAEDYVQHLYDTLIEGIDVEIEDLSSNKNSLNDDIESQGMDLMFPDEDSMEGFDWTLGD